MAEEPSKGGTRGLLMLQDAFPAYRGKMEYVCQECNERFPGDTLLYTCPKCGGVFLLENTFFDKLKDTPGEEWRKIFDARQAVKTPALKGVFRYYELIAPVFEREDIIWLGEANTPIISASSKLSEIVGQPFAYKNDGQNPSASFKDRGMACAFSCLKWLCRIHGWKEVLTICASTGDTSAAAALYASYVGAPVKSVVLLPHGKVTPQQLSQPLGSGATVIEIPGVFDDCMKVVELLAEKYPVALLNSKNSWRILGQESYAYEIAQWHDWDTGDLCVFVPIGNAGNITAVMSGFLKMFELGIIKKLPRIFGAQSERADPVWRYYSVPPASRVWKPVKVRPSVAQAAMIGNPVSFPRVRRLAEKYCDMAGGESFNVIQVKEQQIMDAMLLANRHGHIACTQGGECLAALQNARASRMLRDHEFPVLDSTAHILKFSVFQDQYFQKQLEQSYHIQSDPDLMNRPIELLAGENIELADLPEKASKAIASLLSLTPRQNGKNL